MFEKTGSNWLKSVLNHFKRVRSIKVTTKRLKRNIVKAIWKIIEESGTVRNLAVPNNELRSWCRSVQRDNSSIKLRPLYLKNLKKDKVDVGQYASNKIFEKFNSYMVNATQRYESGCKLNNSHEALALSNIMLIAESNDYNISENDWTEYKNKLKRPDGFVPVQQNEKTTVSKIVKDYSLTVLKDSSTLNRIMSKYKSETSECVKSCLEILKQIGSGVKLWGTYEQTKEEDLFLTSFVDTMLINPLFQDLPPKVQRHGNGHSLKESRLRKIRQAKKNEDNLKGWKGRAPDRSLELQFDKKLSYHVFLCEVKTGSSSRKHPDLAKLGTMLKDLIDFAIENGAESGYYVTGLLVEGLACTLYKVSKPAPKLYHMESIHSFNLPVKVSELEKLDSVLEFLMLSKYMINVSCRQLMAADKANMKEQDSVVNTNYSPSIYADYYV
ncbi:hypothetical protein MFLAVUS_006292 [Mucor flavus]|uniref:Uncharacterized protein n=1 Tax=Mucor flavus TaxID=439312 RepID=A0ABP9Z159_9FUNG